MSTRKALQDAEARRLHSIGTRTIRRMVDVLVAEERSGVRVNANKVPTGPQRPEDLAQLAAFHMFGDGGCDQ